MCNWILDIPDQARACFVFAHGAGAGMESAFMADMAQDLFHQGIAVVRFNFNYMDIIAQTGKRRPPENKVKLLAQFEAVLARVGQDEQLNTLPLFIGGKSMGGRMSTMLLDNTKAPVHGAVVFGYPFHPPGKPDKLRTEHLLEINKKLLIIQGERDTFGTQNEVNSYHLSANISVVFLSDGDHSLKPRKSSGFSYPQHLQLASEYASEFMKNQ
jgi:predicted alpha/beta-hydrolase family hydrolase